MTVISTGSTIFQTKTSKLRRPLDTVDLEELPDSRERTVWEMLSDNSCLSAVLDRQGLQVAAPIDLRTKKAESLLPQLADTGLPAQAQEKESQDGCNVPNC